MGDAAEEEVAHTLAPPAAKSVLYCEEYCAYSAAPARCKEWLAEWTRKNSDVSELVGGLSLAPEAEGKEKDGDDDGDDEDDEGKKRQTRGGKAMPRDGSKKSEKEEAKRKNAKVTIKMVTRNKRKAVTHIHGMEIFGLDLKQVAKRCAGKYACGSSVVKDPAGFDEVVIQGDVVDDLIEFIPAEWPAIDAKKIHVDRKK